MAETMPATTNAAVPITRLTALNRSNRAGMEPSSRWTSAHRNRKPRILQSGPKKAGAAGMLHWIPGRRFGPAGPGRR